MKFSLRGGLLTLNPGQELKCCTQCFAWTLKEHSCLFQLKNTVADYTELNWTDDSRSSEPFFCRNAEHLIFACTKTLKWEVLSCSHRHTSQKEKQQQQKDRQTVLHCFLILELKFALFCTCTFFSVILKGRVSKRFYPSAVINESFRNPDSRVLNSHLTYRYSKRKGKVQVR